MILPYKSVRTLHITVDEKGKLANSNSEVKPHTTYAFGFSGNQELKPPNIHLVLMW